MGYNGQQPAIELPFRNAHCFLKRSFWFAATLASRAGRAVSQYLGVVTGR
jgi:hypothetical protein